MKNPIFIIGLTRSGSTLWHNIIAMNPAICRLAEMHYLTPWRRDFRYFLRKHIGDISNDENIVKMVDMVLSRKYISGLGSPFWRFEKVKALDDPNFRATLIENIISSDRSLKSIFKILIENITTFSGYNQCCVKFPVFVNHMPKLLEWYPDCKIVHITRDPRAIAMSKTNDPGGTAILNEKYSYFTYPIRKTMIFWVIVQYIWASRIHEKLNGNSNYKLFKYEDLLAFPEEIIRGLYEFVGFKFDNTVVDLDLGQHEHQKSSITGIKQKEIDKNTASYWKMKISPFENFFISFMTRRSMKRIGYDPVNHPVFK